MPVLVAVAKAVDNGGAKQSRPSIDMLKTSGPTRGVQASRKVFERAAVDAGETKVSAGGFQSETLKNNRRNKVSCFMPYASVVCRLMALCLR